METTLTSSRSRIRLALAAVALASAPTLPAMAQDFPAKGKAIRVIVAFTPGGGADGQARAVTQRLAEILNTTVVVENRPGGGTLLAANEVMKSAPDGYTLFYSASSTLAQNPHTMAAATYDPMKDFTPISLGARGPLVLAVSGTFPVNNVKELVAYGKANPGKLSYGSFGTGTSSHIFGQVFAANTGVEMVHVPYKGGSELAVDLIGGRLPMAFDAATSAIGYARTGKVRLIAVAAPQRSPFLPDVPTLAEQGVPGLDMQSWLGWFGPPHMPPDVVKTLNTALAAAIATPSVQEFYKTGAYTAESSTPQALAAEVKSSYERWGALIRQAGIPKQ
jgi:tripartite-type tricarboxylate transporter receptor subunit TctC